LDYTYYIEYKEVFRDFPGSPRKLFTDERVDFLRPVNVLKTRSILKLLGTSDPSLTIDLPLYPKAGGD
jgi:hypothetical protein